VYNGANIVANRPLIKNPARGALKGRTRCLVGLSSRQIGARLTIGIDIGSVCVPTSSGPPQSVGTPFEQLLQLDSSIRPGLTESHFLALFTKCACGLITTRSAFKRHYCQDLLKESKMDVIELTDSSDSDEEV
jgi:hypothetical protein